MKEKKERKEEKWTAKMFRDYVELINLTYG